MVAAALEMVAQIDQGVDFLAWELRPAALGASPVYCYDQSGNFLEVFENSHI